MLARNTGDETFPKLFNLLRLLLPLFFSLLLLLLLLSRATRGIMANIVVDVFYFTPLFHIYLFIYFIGSFGCVCVRVLACE